MSGNGRRIEVKTNMAYDNGTVIQMIVPVITENSSLVTICTLTISSTGMHRCLCCQS